MHYLYPHRSALDSPHWLLAHLNPFEYIVAKSFIVEFPKSSSAAQRQLLLLLYSEEETDRPEYMQNGMAAHVGTYRDCSAGKLLLLLLMAINLRDDVSDGGGCAARCRGVCIARTQDAVQNLCKCRQGHSRDYYYCYFRGKRDIRLHVLLLRRNRSFIRHQTDCRRRAPSIQEGRGGLVWSGFYIHSSCWWGAINLNTLSSEARGIYSRI